MTWMDNTALSFKSSTFRKKKKDSKEKKDPISNKKRKTKESDGLNEELRNHSWKMVIVDYFNKPIEPLKIESGDLVVMVGTRGIRKKTSMD